MTTLTLRINERTKKGKAFLAFAKTFFAEGEAVKVVEESPYDPDFVAKVRRAKKQKGVEVKNVKEWIGNM